MKTTTNRVIETFLLITFPLALFAGCAGNANTKTTTVDQIAKHDASNFAITETIAETVVETEQTKDSPIVLLIDILNAERKQAELIAKQQETETNVVFNNPFTVDITEVNQNVETITNIASDPMIVSWLESNQNETIKVPQEINTVEVNFTELKQPNTHIINFALNATDINENYLADLKQHAEFLLKNSNLILTINGHTDSSGSVEYNRQLSQERALNVYSILLSYGAPDMQLIVDAFGESAPVNHETNHTENRRVELQYSEEIVLSAIE